MSTIDELQLSLNYFQVSNTILKAIYLDIPVTLQGYSLSTYNNEIVINATQHCLGDNRDKEERVYLPFDIELNAFMHWCYKEYETNRKWFIDIKRELAILIALNPKLKGNIL